MRAKNRDIHVFNIAMLDVLCGALGAFMFLMLAFMPYFNEIMKFGGLAAFRKLDIADIARLREEITQLKAQVAKVEAEKQKLEEEKRALEDENEALRQRIAELEEEIRKLKEQLAKMSEGDIPKAEYLRLQQKIAELEELVKELKERIAQLEEENKRLKDENAKLEEEREKLTARIDKLEKERDAAERRATQAEAQKAAAITDLRAALQGIGEINASREEARKQKGGDESIVEALKARLARARVPVTFVVEALDGTQSDFELLIRDPAGNWYGRGSYSADFPTMFYHDQLSPTAALKPLTHHAHINRLPEGEYFVGYRRAPEAAPQQFRIGGWVRIIEDEGEARLIRMPPQTVAPTGAIGVAGKLTQVDAKIRWTWFDEPTESEDLTTLRAERARHEEEFNRVPVETLKSGSIAKKGPPLSVAELDAKIAPLQREFDKLQAEVDGRRAQLAITRDEDEEYVKRLKALSRRISLLTQQRNSSALIERGEAATSGNSVSAAPSQ